MAIVLQFVPYNPLALRVTAVICSLGVLLAAYFLVRRWHTPLAAWLTVAWLSVTFWPLSASRFAVRNITLPLVWGLAALVFWWAWEHSGSTDTGQNRKQRWGRYVLAGFLAGLCLYTYQPARFIPFIFMAFFVYLFLCHRQQWRARWRDFGLMSVTAVLIALPLVIALSVSPGGEIGQRAFTLKPLTQLLSGDPRPALANILAMAKAFTISGDPLESYNLPGRPIFSPSWTGLFFYAGLAQALWRWRRPVYAFALFWLLITLMPTVLTISAPNFNRIIAAQAPIMFLAALPMAELTQLATAQWARNGLSLVSDHRPGVFGGSGYLHVA